MKYSGHLAFLFLRNEENLSHKRPWKSAGFEISEMSPILLVVLRTVLLFFLFFSSPENIKKDKQINKRINLRGRCFFVETKKVKKKLKCSWS